MASERIGAALAITLELTGTTWSDDAMRVALAELGRHDEREALAALTACARDLKFRLTLADVIERMPGQMAYRRAAIRKAERICGRPLRPPTLARAEEVLAIFAGHDWPAYQDRLRARSTAAITDQRRPAK